MIKAIYVVRQKGSKIYANGNVKIVINFVIWQMILVAYSEKKLWHNDAKILIRGLQW